MKVKATDGTSSDASVVVNVEQHMSGRPLACIQIGNSVATAWFDRDQLDSLIAAIESAQTELSARNLAARRGK